MAFEEVASPRRPSTSSAPKHTRSQSQPLAPAKKRRPVVPANRARAPSDPFLDTHAPPLSQSLESSHSGSSQSDTLLPALIPDADDPPSPVSTCGDEYIPSSQLFNNDNDEVGEDEESFRIWTSPDLSNSDYLSLIALFPSFVTRHTLPYFPSAPLSRDVEEAFDDFSREDRSIRCGTGTMWLGPQQRSPGWEGGWWSRFLFWWKKTFC